LSVTLGAYSLLLLNFPTWVLFKSARILFVMMGGVIILGKRYSKLQCCSACLLALGLVLFTIGDMKVHPKFNFLGTLLKKYNNSFDFFPSEITKQLMVIIHFIWFFCCKFQELC
jgi:hypothetical protein